MKPRISLWIRRDEEEAVTISFFDNDKKQMMMFRYVTTLSNSKLVRNFVRQYDNKVILNNMSNMNLIVF